MMFTNENTYIQKEENLFVKLIKTHQGLILVESYLKNKKLELIKFNTINFIIEKCFKLALPLFSICLTIFLYYFYIFVRKFF